MFDRNVIYLISQSPDPRGFTDPVKETEQMVYVPSEASATPKSTKP